MTNTCYIIIHVLKMCKDNYDFDSISLTVKILKDGSNNPTLINITPFQIF